jgi:hypothetical protein
VFKIDIEVEAREVEANMNLIWQDGIISQSQSDFASPIVVEKRNGFLHVHIGENNSECAAVVVPTSSCFEDAVVLNENLLDESVTMDITAVASDGNNTDGCDENFVGFRIEYRVSYTVEQTKSKNLGISVEKKEVVRPLSVISKRDVNEAAAKSKQFR